MNAGGGPMNPLTWRREHRLALAIAVFIAAAIGLAVGIAAVEDCCYRVRIHLWCEAGYSHCRDFVPVYWFLVLLWALAFGVVAGAGVYVQKLLRS